MAAPKQSNLFSFFSKAPSPKPSAAVPPAAKASVVEAQGGGVGGREWGSSSSSSSSSNKKPKLGSALDKQQPAKAAKKAVVAEASDDELEATFSSGDDDDDDEDEDEDFSDDDDGASDSDDDAFDSDDDDDDAAPARSSKKRPPSSSSSRPSKKKSSHSSSTSKEDWMDSDASSDASPDPKKLRRLIKGPAVKVSSSAATPDAPRASGPSSSSSSKRRPSSSSGTGSVEAKDKTNSLAKFKLEVVAEPCNTPADRGASDEVVAGVGVAGGRAPPSSVTPGSALSKGKASSTPSSSSSSSVSSRFPSPSPGDFKSSPSSGGGGVVVGSGGSGSKASLSKGDDGKSELSSSPDRWQDDAVNPLGTHVHNHLPFLQPGRLRDKAGILKGQPGYDPRTLQWSAAEIEKVTGSSVTAAKQQWWDLKSQYYDAVLLFKTGKFYEMFHMDADIAVRHLDFNFMKGKEAHAGAPEAAYGAVCKKLVELGYRVARVEQTETPEQMEARKKKAPKGHKPSVVNREVCAVTTVGTRTFCFLDDTRCFEAEGGGKSKGGMSSADIGPLLAIREVMLPYVPPTPSSSSSSSSAAAADADADAPPPAICEYGITLVDSVRGVVTLGQFADDSLRSRLHTLLACVQPSEVLLQEGASRDLKAMLASVCPRAVVGGVNEREYLPKSTAVDDKVRKMLDRPGPAKPWDAAETVGEFSRRDYFGDSPPPPVLRAVIDGNASLALSALGAALFYLQRSLIDHDVLSMADFRAYVPADSTQADTRSKATDAGEGHRLCAGLSERGANVEEGIAEEETGGDKKAAADAKGREAGDDKAAAAAASSSSSSAPRDHMELDGITLDNLEVLVNQGDGTSKGSLWSKINRCKSPPGTRLLRAWLLRPLYRKSDIQRRCDAVSELSSGAAALAMAEVRPCLAKVGDVERYLARVHAMGAQSDDPAHPNNRAVLYEEKAYAKRKVEDFQKLLMGLKMADRIADAFAKVDISSPLLQKLVWRSDAGAGRSGSFPEITDKLRWFNENFDAKRALEGTFEPAPGTDKEYDAAVADVKDVERKLEELKNEYIEENRNGGMTKGNFLYINTKHESRDKYLIELPVGVRVPSSFIVKGKRGTGNKQICKYYTADVEDYVNQLEAAIERQRLGRCRGLASIFAKFDKYRPLWSAVTLAISMLDALGALADISSQPGFSRPVILDAESDKESKIEILGGRHPCVEVTHDGNDFVPNDMSLGGDGARVLLLSGPNMGGKSTLLRQTCLISILAQIGCFVPAKSCTITPFDRIFTRLGACDRILSGQSTFFVELSETAAALRGATRRSMVIMDELGRGTSTFDGTAIAHAVVKCLVEQAKPLAMFATHYHSLLEDWKAVPTVKLGHMKCLVEDGGLQRITFLYQLGEGPCPKSFGINVARLAALPEAVLAIAAEKSNSFASEMEEGGGKATDKASLLVERIKAAALKGDAEELQQLWEEARRA